MVEIGAGGGSIARIDRLKRIAVGPDSAGAEPGPVCYGRGGTAPTVTDANLLLGRLDAGGFAGGRMPLATPLAREALDAHIAAPQALDLPWAAAGIVELVEENMANAARVHAIERGKDTARCALIAFGGAAPLHAVSLARRLGMNSVVIPAGAGVGSALGFLKAPIAFESVRSWRRNAHTLNLDELNQLLVRLESQASEIVRGGARGAALVVRRSVDMRYMGQGHELQVELAAGTVDQSALERLCEAFESRYEIQYGVRVRGVGLECLTWTVSVAAADDVKPAASRFTSEPSPASGSSVKRAKRWVFVPADGQWVEHDVHVRAQLSSGQSVTGPALVTEAQTTTLIPAGWVLTRHIDGHLLIDRTSSDGTP
jgi:N-methylhydantoinase A